MATIVIKFLEKTQQCQKYMVSLLAMGGFGSTSGTVTYLDCNNREKVVNLTMLETMDVGGRSNSTKFICATKILNTSNENIYVKNLNESCDGTETEESLNPHRTNSTPIIIEN